MIWQKTLVLCHKINQSPDSSSRWPPANVNSLLWMPTKLWIVMVREYRQPHLSQCWPRPHGGAQSPDFLPQFRHPLHWCNANKWMERDDRLENRGKLPSEMGHQWVLGDIPNWNSHWEDHWRGNTQQNFRKTIGLAVFPVYRMSSWLPSCAPSHLPVPISSLSFFILQLFGFFSPPSIYLLFNFWRKGMRFLFYARMVLSPLTQNPEVLTEYKRIINHHHCGLGGFYSLPSPLWCFFKRKEGRKKKNTQTTCGEEKRRKALRLIGMQRFMENQFRPRDPVPSESNQTPFLALWCFRVPSMQLFPCLPTAHPLFSLIICFAKLLSINNYSR